MKSRPLKLAVAFALLAAPVLLAAFAVGGFAYTKRPETALLAEPNALAEPAARVPYARQLKVEEVRGRWLRVKEGKSAGWVFAGNLSATAPVEGKGADGLGLDASQTTATAAARGLSPAAVEYAGRRNLADARENLDWLVTQCQGITPDDVSAFLQEKKKGEFQ